MHPTVEQVTDRIRARSRDVRAAYLARCRRAGDEGPERRVLSCSNLAHVTAASGTGTRRLWRRGGPAISASSPPSTTCSRPISPSSASRRLIIRSAAREAGGTAQVAGGVPAMCDGVTQGQPGMELSLFSRDVIALAAGVALSHNCFDARSIWASATRSCPGLVMAAATFGHHPGDLRAGGADDLGSAE